MARYTWTKLKCKDCGQVERYRGKPYNTGFCTTCKSYGVQIVAIHWGNEKYAGEKAGTTERFPIG